jgi:ABC-type nitrate/sulfonate/bicarbonate transport system permease component
MVATATAPQVRRGPIPSWLTSAIGIFGLLAIWQVVGATMFKQSGSVPTPTRVVSEVWNDPDFYWRNLSTTMKAAAQGWLWGNLLAIGLAFLVLVVPIVERPVIQIGVVSYCLPIVAIGPIFTIVFDGQTPKVVLAAMSVFFTTLVGALVGLRSADPTALDMVHAFGGGSVNKLSKVRFRAGLPSLFAALRVAAPAAVLGAIIGEYFGADRGIGVAMIASQQRLDAPTTWALALVATTAAGLAYALTAAVGRMLTPWAPRSIG